MGKELHRELTLKQQRFCDAYLVSGVASQAAREAGYSESGLSVAAHHLLANPRIRAYIQSHRKTEQATTKTRREKIERELELMAFARISRFTRVDADGLPQVDFSNATEEDLAAVTSVQSKRRTIYNPKGEVVGVEDQSKFNMADKYKGLELLGKLEGMFKEEATVTIDVADRLLSARARLMKNVTPEDSEEE